VRLTFPSLAAEERGRDMGWKEGGRGRDGGSGGRGTIEGGEVLREWRDEVWKF